MASKTLRASVKRQGILRPENKFIFFSTQQEVFCDDGDDETNWDNRRMKE